MCDRAACVSIRAGKLALKWITGRSPSLAADYNALQAKYAALLTHMDVANVAALGTAHVATYGAPRHRQLRRRRSDRSD
jgi:hypothetical protein